jgi:hypothetical protein
MKSKVLQQIMDRTKKFSKKLNKTINNKSILKNVKSFVKNYLLQMNINFKYSTKFDHLYKPPTKRKRIAYNTFLIENMML